MNVDNKRFVFNLAIDNSIQEVQKDDPHIIKTCYCIKSRLER